MQRVGDGESRVGEGRVGGGVGEEMYGGGEIALDKRRLKSHNLTRLLLIRANPVS